MLPWECLSIERRYNCSSALFFCQYSFPDFMQTHKHGVYLVWGFVSVLAVVRGQSSRHNRSQQMSLYLFLPLFLSFVSAVRRWSSPAETDEGWIKQENESNVAQPFCHHIDLFSFLTPWRFCGCWCCFSSTSSNTAILLHYCPAAHPCGDPSEIWICTLKASASFMKQRRYLGILA